MATISLSPLYTFTIAVGAPRVAAIEHPCGQTIGKPGDVSGQTAVLRATLQTLATIQEPNEIAHLPFTWPEPAKAVQDHPTEDPPIVKAIRKRPWLYRNLLLGNIPE